MIQVFSASTVGIQTQNGGMLQNRTAEEEKNIPAVNKSSCSCSHFESLFCC